MDSRGLSGPALPRSRGLALPLALVALALAVGAACWTAWPLLHPKPPGDPLATSLVAFERQNRLTVFSAELAPVVTSDQTRLFGMIRSRQVAVIPARVDYTIDLARMDRSRMAWDAARRRLDVTLPPLQLSRPNLDEARAQYLSEGVWITRATQEQLTRENTQGAERQAASAAANPALMSLARGAARDAVRQNLEIPLAVAGFGDVTVAVRFDGEAIAK